MLTFIRANLEYFRIAAYLLLAAAIFGAGWTVQGWRKDAVIADLQKDSADGRAQQSQVAINDLAKAIKDIRASAGDAQANLSGLGSKLETINKGYQNAKPASLPADCRPDLVRVLKLTTTIDAINEAIAR